MRFQFRKLVQILNKKVEGAPKGLKKIGGAPKTSLNEGFMKGFMT